MEAPTAALLALAMLAMPLVGCIGTDSSLESQSTSEQPGTNATDYEVPERNPDIEIEEFGRLLDADVGDVKIHVRIVKPADADDVPVIAEFTPYNAPGEPMLVEPPVDFTRHYYVQQFVERGFAFAFADVRGTSDSGGCLDLRGSVDVEDAGRLTEFLGTRDWSNGNVGFIGASYPGSMAHIAGIADDEHLGGIVPIVASTSFYDWHHKNGVPYSHHPATFYYTQDATPSVNPQYENWLTKEAYQATECNQDTRLMNGLDHTGTYDDWWQDRDLNHRTDEVHVPVLMAHGLADWNVKPDHIDPYFNELDTNKILVAEQMSHSFPDDADEAYGDWWELVAAFFDETLGGAETGLFDEDLAYVEDNQGDWHTYEDAWPPQDPDTAIVNLTADGLTFDEAPSGEVAWAAPPVGQQRLATSPTEVVLESPPLEEDLHVSGTPHLNLTVVTEEEQIHLVAVLEAGNGDGDATGDDGFVRENYGYLNPTYRHGLEDPQRVIPGDETPVTIEMYAQEDVFEEGDKLRLTLSSTDGGRTLETGYEPGEITAVFDGERPAQLVLPLSPIEG